MAPGHTREKAPGNFGPFWLTDFGPHMRDRMMQAAALGGVWYAVVLHVVWIVALLAGGAAATRATAVHGPATLFPNRFGLAIVFGTAAGCALAAIFSKLRPAKLMLLVPQQLVLGVSAAAGLRAMVVGHFADGAPRPHWFIIADQAPAVIALVVHSLTIVYLAVRLNRWADANEP